jgi:glucose dehydrogenase
MSNTTVTSIVISVLFLLSGVGASVLINPVGATPNGSSAAVSAAPVALAATPLTSLQDNWESPDGQFNSNYSPQTQINSSNVQDLGLSWLFPLPGHPPQLIDTSGGLGSVAPLIINGTVYIYAQDMQVFALNAASGDVLWTDVLPIFPNSTAGHGTGALALHIHGDFETYTTTLFHNTPTIWVSGGDQKIYAMNALNGTYELSFNDFSGISTVAGNNPGALYTGSSGLLVDQKLGIVITSIESGSSADTGRCFFRGWNVLVTPPQLEWTAYCTPPQPGGSLSVDPSYAVKQVQNMSGAEIFYPGPGPLPGGNIPNNNGQAVVNLKTLSPSVLNSTLYNDWGEAIQSANCKAIDGGGSTGSTAAGWGAPWLLGTGPTAGLAFVNTNNRDPYTSACETGPSLWSASILALNETTGQWVWGFQGSTHDQWDYDCSWWQGLGNETINGVNTQVIWKTCKAGYLFELNAVTGNLIWAWTPPLSIQPRCEYCYLENPLNSTQMQLAFANPSLNATLMYPFSFAFEGEDSYNPATNYIYVVSDNNPRLVYYVAMNSTNYKSDPGTSAIGPQGQTAAEGTWDNCSVIAVNAATGQMVWNYFIPLQGYRGALTTAGNVVYITLSSGNLLMLDATKGTLLRNYYIGGPLNVGVQVGATDSGITQLIVPITIGDEAWAGAQGVPGDIVALDLQSASSGGVATITTTVGTGPTTTVTAASTTITVSTATGVSTTVAYGLAAVAVVFIIGTGYFAMRGRKPAS